MMQMTEANLSLNNVKLKKDALIKLKLPINIELGEIRNLYVSQFLCLKTTRSEYLGLRLEVNRSKWQFRVCTLLSHLKRKTNGDSLTSLRENTLSRHF